MNVETTYFKGKINVSRNSMFGSWGTTPEADKGFFFLKEVSSRKAKITLNFVDELQPVKSNVTINMSTMEAYTTNDDEQMI